MTLGDTIRHGVSWLLAGRIGNQLLHLVFAIVLARLLMPEDFGLLVTVQIFTGVAMLVSGGGMGQALVQAKVLGPHDSHVVFTAQLLIGCAIYLLFFLLAPWFARWFNQSIYTDLLRVSALIFIIRPISNVPSSLLKRALRFKAKAIIGSIQMALTGIASIALALAGYGVWALVLGGMFGSVVNMALTMYVARWRPGILLNRAALKPLAGYGIQVSVNDIIRHIYNHTTNFIISRFMGPAAVGIFNKSTSLREAPESIIGMSAQTVIFRALSKSQDNLDQSRYIFLRTLTLVSLYTLPFYVGFAWIAEPFIVTLYGAHWRDAAEPLTILSASGIFLIFYRQALAVSAARRCLMQEMAILGVSWVVLVISVGIGYQWGLAGISWGVVFATIVMSVLMTRLAVRELQLRVRDLWRAVRPVLLLNTLLAVGLWFAHTSVLARYEQQHALYLFSMAAVGGALYTLCFLYLPIAALASEAQRWKSRLHLPGAAPSSPD